MSEREKRTRTPLNECGMKGFKLAKPIDSSRRVGRRRLSRRVATVLSVRIDIWSDWR
jgi:hypothetical protein